ncbi:MAG: sensor domain-containing diguanylate cyclase [Negativicutes bacterium]|nr:sensor domain-containing diguanylate cyclase [Negativicutes bacterium]
MANELLYESFLNLVKDAVPSAFILIGGDGNIREIQMTGLGIAKRQRLIGKSFSKIMYRLFGEQNTNIVCGAQQNCLEGAKLVVIPKICYVSPRGLTEYFKWHLAPAAEANSFIAFVQNITESVLIEEEFNTICEQHDVVNRELCIAMSNLDFQFMDLEQAHRKLAALYRITSVVQRTVILTEVLAEIVDGLTHELGFINAAIFLLEEETQELRIMAHRGYRDNIRVHISQGVIGYACRLRELVYVPDVTCAPRYIPGTSQGASEVAVPLIVNDRVIGVMDVETPAGKIMNKYDLDLLRSLASQIALTIAHATHVADVQMQAVTDSLTGLSNYRYFRSALDMEVKRALRYERPLALLMIDIDNYKRYNDTYGHRMGDEVLRSVATVIRDSVRDVDIVARYGGEEFVVLCPETTLGEARIIAERIRFNVEKYPFPNKQTQPGGTLTVSVGVAEYPSDASTAEELIDHADKALYAAKSMSKNCVRIFGLDFSLGAEQRY